MRIRILIAVAVVAVIVVYALHRGKFVSEPAGAVHSIAPDFSLTDLNGQKVTLSQYRGKVVLLNFWATWCAPCRAETPQLVKLQENYRPQGLRVLGISLDDDAKDVPPFYQEFHMNYPVAVGDAHLAERYGGVLGLPVSFIVDCGGRIEARFIGGLNFPAAETQIHSLLQNPDCVTEKN